ncbi:type B DNA-directed DNA polymerase [Halomicroarcula sp. GCM10025324]|uniref:type B DNA-directed DNA polymerase n=1 Tax=Haloarcula TaxID=2237 RepID=UPI0023E8F46C|nr:type B DNA-directed DNA polymerase [Halomicroarcula sp. ZS-22-S1]
MAFAFEVTADGVRVWSRDPDEDATVRTDRAYRPSLFAAGPDDALTTLEARLARDPKVEATSVASRYTSLRDDAPSDVLRVDTVPGSVRQVAREIRCVHEPDAWAPGTVCLYNVDLDPTARYCLETETSPVPEADLRSLSLSLPTAALADGDLTALTCESEALAPDATSDRAVLRALADSLATRDPDVLVLSSADLVPLLSDRADEQGVDVSLGRQPGYRRLAGANTYQSYGRVGHSPARYAVPGRAIVDRSNSFLWDEGGLPGLLDLVERSWLPLQALSRSSIGTVFTGIQIREAFERGVLVPWRAWEPEAFKDARTLHDADRGGFTFEPHVGFHEDVVEVDFASLYPRIMCEYNLSPETVRCDCHDESDVPGLGYSVCGDPGFVPSVLRPILDDRAEIKARLADADPDSVEADGLEARSGALKWILVTCFGYQGYRNSKFGRIECHEAINAHAREMLLDAKDTLEAGGWRVLHGIVDSLWVTPRVTDPTPIAELTTAISADAGIPLEHENDFSWVAFVPKQDGRGGSLTSYVGKVAGRDEFKIRGLAARRRSICGFVATAQRDLLRTLDAHRDPGAVCDRLARHVARLEAGTVDAADLVVRTRVSKSLEGYDRRSRTVAALERYRDHGIERHPGQDVRYVVVDDGVRSRERVRLDFEAGGDYDAGFYRERLVRAAGEVVSPLGWDRDRVRAYLRDTRDTTLGAFE